MFFYPCLKVPNVPQSLRSLFATVYLTFLCALFVPFAAEARGFRCKASDPQNGTPIFSCTGNEILTAGKPVSAQIRYKLPNGKVFARESINFRKDRFSPDLVFTDERDGRREMIEKTPTGFNLLFQDSAKGMPEAHHLRHGDGAIPALSVPGLPQFVEENWQRVLAGEKIVFYCVFPLQRKLVRLRAQLEQKGTYRKTAVVILRVQPENFVYRWFSEPVYLTFSLKNKRLMRYQGLHYVRDPRTGGGSVVDLQFEW